MSIQYIIMTTTRKQNGGFIGSLLQAVGLTSGSPAKSDEVPTTLPSTPPSQFGGKRRRRKRGTAKKSKK
jgi:hypothetical protein